MNKKTCMNIGKLLLVFVLLSSLCLIIVVWPPSQLLIYRMNKIGLEQIKADAKNLLDSKQRGTLKEDIIPESIKKLNPDHVRVEDDYVCIVIQPFNGNKETGIKIYRHKNIPKGRHDTHKVDDIVSIYEVW